jgi:nitrogen fixation protein NifQ
MQGYTETIRKFAAAESHVGRLENPDGTGEVGLSSQEMGRRLAIRFTLKLTGDLVQSVRYQVFGCGFTIAACAAVASLSEGRRLHELRKINPAIIDQTLGGLPEERLYCAELANEALHAAIASIDAGAGPMQVDMQTNSAAAEHGPRLNGDDPIYRTLLGTPSPAGISAADRHLFACVLSLAAREPYAPASALGLKQSELQTLLHTFFPASCTDYWTLNTPPAAAPPPKTNPDVLNILLSHIRETGTLEELMSRWLAHILAARAAQPGHLWVAMGLFERPQLTAAIRRQLPTLVEANNQGMRWKRFLFKQICELNGGMMCKSPNCGDCSDYARCFSPD